MLSAESAAGQYPVEAVATMNRIAEEVERDPFYRTIIHAQRTEPEATGADAIAAAARQIAETLELSAIVSWTSSGSTGLRVARERPSIAHRRDLAQGLDRPPAVARLGRALHRGGGRPRSRRYGGARLPARLQGRIRQGGSARHHRRRRPARHARRDQHAAYCVCRGRDGEGGRMTERRTTEDRSMIVVRPLSSVFPSSDVPPVDLVGQLLDQIGNALQVRMHGERAAEHFQRVLVVAESPAG